ncbi:MAG: DUF3999 family protein [Bacteroidia bacterium]|nr:DUF3999 family protein [Bacteroidia bacterium]
MKLKFSLLLLFAGVSVTLSAQMSSYNYRREISGITGQWHTLILPEDLFEKSYSHMNDLRIYGITKNNDTVEAPYLFKSLNATPKTEETGFKIINESHNANGFYYTLLPELTIPLNDINLNFEEKNFDRLINLEGSENNKEWFTILENYRVLSIENEITRFHFSRLVFPEASFKYFRVLVKGNKDPQLSDAKMQRVKAAEQHLKTYSSKIKTTELKTNKQTIADIALLHAVPLSKITIDVSDKFDYFRNISISYLSDSFKTDLGWKYNYSALTTGSLNSFEKGSFEFNEIITKKLRITIENGDNEALNISNISVEGTVPELLVRFTKNADYFLCYGNKVTFQPQYDIAKFSVNTINSPILTLLPEQTFIKSNNVSEPLLKSKFWLWGLMLLIALILGYFSYRMLKNK